MRSILFIIAFAAVLASVAAKPHSVSTRPSLGRPAPSGDIFLHDSSGVVYDNSSKLYYTSAPPLPPIPSLPHPPHPISTPSLT